MIIFVFQIHITTFEEEDMVVELEKLMLLIKEKHAVLKSIYNPVDRIDGLYRLIIYILSECKIPEVTKEIIIGPLLSEITKLASTSSPEIRREFGYLFEQ